MSQNINIRPWFFQISTFLKETLLSQANIFLSNHNFSLWFTRGLKINNNNNTDSNRNSLSLITRQKSTSLSIFHSFPFLNTKRFSNILASSSIWTYNVFFSHFNILCAKIYDSKWNFYIYLDKVPQDIERDRKNLLKKLCLATRIETTYFL